MADHAILHSALIRHEQPLVCKNKATAQGYNHKEKCYTGRCATASSSMQQRVAPSHVQL